MITTITCIKTEKNDKDLDNLIDDIDNDKH